MMEPAAPGTEDEVKLPVVTTVSKKETEQERLLSIKVRLPSGKVGNVFELTFTQGSEQWYCNLCQCPIMGRVYHHEIGKRHTNNMTGRSRVEDDDPLLVAPGEPIPPGVESEVQKIAEIQERLDNFTVGPLIGLEYLFELIDQDKEPSYLCLLCDKRGDPRTVIAHLASYNHIIQYVQRHFVTCFRAIAPYITKQYKRNWQFTMQKIAEAIESKFGRLKPHVAELGTFDQNRMYYQNIVASGPHFNERAGVTFEELVCKEQLTKVVADEVTMAKLSEEVTKRPYRKTGTEPGFEVASKKSKRSPSPPIVAKPKKPKPAHVPNEKRQSLSSVSSISSSDLSDFENSALAKKKELQNRKKQPSKFQPTGRAKKFERKSRSRSGSPGRYRRGAHPWERSNYRSRADVVTDTNKQKTDKSEEYKKLATAIENDMARVLKQHEKNPEKHPQYNDEWKKYWNRRYKELQGEGKDVANYDFKPEWIEFWNKRMPELHHAEIKNKKDALRKRLGLPEEPAPICFKITGKKKPSKEQSETKVEVPSTTNDQDSDVIVIDDKDDDTVSSKRSHSPWENELGALTRKSRDKNREASRTSSKEFSRSSKDRSRDYRHSRSRSKERDWSKQGRRRERDREYVREFGHDGGYYRESYRKSSLPEYIKPPRVMRDVTRHPVMSPPLMHGEPIEADFNEDDINIVSVLRLLTALEEKLGSLGPKIIDLLAQALALEKTEANSAEVLLDNEVNCVLFETVKEKLKGQLLAGFVDYNQEKAFKNAIKIIASLIHYAGERKKRLEKDKPKVDPIQVPGVGTVDKAAIAKQIASALVLQGKTDVSQAELEQLINAVVGMAEASRNSNKQITTASFLQQLSQSNQSSVTAQPETNSPAAQPENNTPAAQPSSQSATQPAAQPTPETISANSMEGLSDLDLQTLLQNFKDLCTDEQHSLISYLKKLEAKEPERVERLRKFVNLDAEKPPEKDKTDVNPRSSPFANRLTSMNPIVEEKAETTKLEPTVETKVNLDSDDEDYSFEDVFKAAKQNVKEKEERDRINTHTSMFKTEDFDLSNAKSLIANIMGQFKSNNSGFGNNSSNLLGLGKSSPQVENIDDYPSFENMPALHNLPKPMISSSQNRLESNIPLSRVENNFHVPSENTPFSSNYSQNLSYPQQNNHYMNYSNVYSSTNQPTRPNFERNNLSYPEINDGNTQEAAMHGTPSIANYDYNNIW